MPQNFLPCERDQQYLMPPSLRGWLPEGHLAWFVLDTVAQMDPSAFYAAYRPDGWGRAACEPAMLVPLLLYDSGQHPANGSNPDIVTARRRRRM